MDPEKLASTLEYLKGIQETRGMTTGASDSDYWSQTAESELGIEETIGKFNSIILILAGRAVARVVVFCSGEKIVFCSWERDVTPTLHLPTQENTWVQANCKCPDVFLQL